MAGQDRVLTAEGASDSRFVGRTVSAPRWVSSLGLSLVFVGAVREGGGGCDEAPFV